MNKQEHGSAIKPVRPGVAFGKRKARGFPKGRQVETLALKEIAKLLDCGGKMSTSIEVVAPVAAPNSADTEQRG
jgi:hypothetical protein